MDIPEASSEDEGMELRSRSRVANRNMEVMPSWAKRLESKVYKLFCFQKDNEKRAYQAHTRENKNRQCTKRMMQKMGMTCPSGSEDRITEEKDWISKHGSWEDEASSSRRGPPPPTRDEEDEEDQDDSDEDDEDDV